MSICCAFSFSLIIFFVLFCFPCDGVGEACAGVVTFFEGFYQRSWVSPLPAVPLHPWPLWFCVYLLLATDPSPHAQLLPLGNPVCTALVTNVHCGSGCFAFFSFIFFSPYIGTAWPAPTRLSCSHPRTQDTRSEPGGSVCMCVVRVFFIFLSSEAGKGGVFCTTSQKILPRFWLWISSPSPFHLSNGAFLAVKFHLHYNES